MRLREGVPAFRLRRWLLDVVRAAGALPEGIRVESFPNLDRVKDEGFRPLVKLPLGVHSRTGRRCALLDERGEPVDDPFETIRSLPRLPAEVVLETSGPERAPAAPSAEIGPRAQRMIDGCHLLGYLARKAEATRYLDHRERLSLLCTLGHLGAEGTAALHATIGHTYNYRPEITQRHVDRLPSSPISCPKLRELHPEAAATHPCECRFELRGRGYPTPLLFGLKASEIAAFRVAASKKTSRPAPQAPRPSDPAPSKGTGGGDSGSAIARAEEKVKKIAELKRHRRGIEASIDRLRGELEEILAESGQDSLQLTMGTLKQVPKDDGEGSELVIEV